MPPGPEHAATACCSNAVCRPPGPPTRPPPVARWKLETLQHALLDCPAVRPALLWLAQTWARIGGDRPPPPTAAVWLLADPAAWHPQRRTLAPLWRTLRTALLAAAWGLRCRREASGHQHSAADVVAAFVEDVRRLVVADWHRVVSHITEMAGTHASWFPRRNEVMTVMDFEIAWCTGSVIAHVTHGAGRPTLEFWLDREAEGFMAAAAAAAAAAATAAVGTTVAAAVAEPGEAARRRAPGAPG